MIRDPFAKTSLYFPSVSCKLRSFANSRLSRRSFSEGGRISLQVQRLHCIKTSQHSQVCWGIYFSQTIAIRRTGASVAFLILVGKTKTLAPVGGSSSALATFSTRYLSAPRMERCTGKPFFPVSHEKVSIPIPTIPLFTSSSAVDTSTLGNA